MKGTTKCHWCKELIGKADSTMIGHHWWHNSCYILLRDLERDAAAVARYECFSCGNAEEDEADTAEAAAAQVGRTMRAAAWRHVIIGDSIGWACPDCAPSGKPAQ